MNNKDTGVLIVLYNKKLQDSKSFMSLLENIDSLSAIIVHNNGPVAVHYPKDIPPTSKIKITNALSNESLSKIYNRFINENSFDRYVIFDDDSIVTDKYIESLVNEKTHFDLGIPLIESEHDGGIYYPVIDSKPVDREKTITLNNMQGDTYSIGSGIVISKELKSIFIDSFNSVFDERFYFYGVDITFFKRLLTLKEKNLVIKIDSTIVHSLSKYESGKKSKFRMRELFIDQILQHVFYSKRYVVLSKFMIKSIGILSIKDYSMILKSIINKTHYGNIK